MVGICPWTWMLIVMFVNPFVSSDGIRFDAMLCFSLNQIYPPLLIYCLHNNLPTTNHTALQISHSSSPHVTAVDDAFFCPFVHCIVFIAAIIGESMPQCLLHSVWAKEALCRQWTMKGHRRWPAGWPAAEETAAWVAKSTFSAISVACGDGRRLV